MNIANRITMCRIFLIPFFITSLSLEGVFFKSIALFIFVIASISDWLDGYIARKNNLISDFGKFMDPLADKMIICSAFICFVASVQLSIPAWMVVIIISREFAITGIRILAASKGVVIHAGNLGKFKTTSQMISIIIILLILIIKSAEITLINDSYLELIPFILVLITSALTLYSGYRYIVENIDLIKEH